MVFSSLHAPWQHRRGLLSITLAAALWGTVGVTIQTVYQLVDTTPLAVASLRLGLAVPFLVLAWTVTRGYRSRQIQGRHLGTMLLLGLMLAVYQLCYFSAIPLIGVAIATLVTLCSAPILVAILAAAVLGETLSRRVLLALAEALAGTILLIGQPADSETTATAVGLMLALGSATGYAVVTLCGRALADHYHPLQPLTIGFSTGALLLLAAALPSGLPLSGSPLAWGLLLYLAIIPSALAYALFLWGLQHTSATAASIVTLLEPLVAVGLATLLYGERLGPLGLIGALLLLSAVALLATTPPSKPH